MGWFPALYSDLWLELVREGWFERGVVRGYDVRPARGGECECEEETALSVSEVTVYQRTAENIHYSAQ